MGNRLGGGRVVQGLEQGDQGGDRVDRARLGQPRGEEWMESGYILKVEPMGFLTGLEVKSR